MIRLVYTANLVIACAGALRIVTKDGKFVAVAVQAPGGIAVAKLGGLDERRAHQHTAAYQREYKRRRRAERAAP